MRTWWLLAIVWCMAWVPAQAAPRADMPGYFRFPALTRDAIVFTAEGDLWRVPLIGGEAVRLTTHDGEEAHAAVSPDGRRLAFSASFDGPVEVYVMPLGGAAPKRLTYEGETALVVGWTPSGEILYSTRRHADLPSMHLARLDPATGVSSLVPLALASDGAFDATGRTLFFTRFPFQGSFTKRYQGGGAQSIWRYADNAAEAEPLTADHPGTSRSPMVWGERVYFVSDRDGTMNLWSMATDGSDVRQLTRHADFDVQEPDLAHGRIAYQHGADLRLFHIATGADAVVPIRLASEFTQMRERRLASPLEWVTSAHLSPTGDRVVVTARGQVFVATASPGPVTTTARQPGVRYRDARFLADGRTLLAHGDATGEFEFWRLSADGTGVPVAVTSGASMLRDDGVPSPDGRHVASQDHDRRLWVYDIASGSGRHVATSRHGDFRDLRWSTDGKWLAYVQTTDTAVSRIWIYDTLDGLARPVTTERFDSYGPTWSSDGAWLYFLSDRHFESLVPSPWGPRQPEPYFDRQTRAYELALRPGLTSRFATLAQRAAPPRAAARPRPASREAGDDIARTQIDFAGLGERLSEIPVVPGNYSHLDTDGTRLYFLAWSAAPSPRKDLKVMPMDDSRAVHTLARDIRSFELSLDRSTLLVEKGGHYHVLPADGAVPKDLSAARVRLRDWEVVVQPRDEWRQIFLDAWRMQRDGFYDRGMHGVDWTAVRRRYEALLTRVTDRAELSDVIAQMVGELSALHMFVRGGDVRKPADTAIASLGASAVRDPARGGHRITRILTGNPDLPHQRSPLAAPHVDVREGDVILRVDGVGTLAAPHLASLLRDAVGRDVRLHVRSGDADVVREVTVQPISLRREADLRYVEWQLGRRHYVDDTTARQVGYLHLRSMTSDDMAEWQRSYYPVHRRPGLIIDLRRNTGGNIDSWLLARLLRQAWFFWQPRVGEAAANMPYAYQGHVAVLIDQETASDGEAFAEGVKRLGLGVVIGTRTWGGEIWGSGGTALLDRGTAAVPETGVFGTDGAWLIEGHGVDPDIEVDNLPRATFDGADAQLDAAIAYLTRRIREAPLVPVTAPAYPDKRLAR